MSRKKDLVAVSVITLFFLLIIALVIAWFKLKEQRINEQLEKMHTQTDKT